MGEMEGAGRSRQKEGDERGTEGGQMKGRIEGMMD